MFVGSEVVHKPKGNTTRGLFVGWLLCLPYNYSLSFIAGQTQSQPCLFTEVRTLADSRQNRVDLEKQLKALLELIRMSKTCCFFLNIPNRDFLMAIR